MAKQESLGLTVKVRPVNRPCHGCVISGLRLCSLCAGLVTDEEGRVYVSSVPLIEDGNWASVPVDRLSPPPKALLIE